MSESAHVQPPGGAADTPSAARPNPTLEVEVEHAGRMLHRVRIRNREAVKRLSARAEVPLASFELERLSQREFVIYSDEPAFLGGEDHHPAPLEYFAAGIGT